MKFELWSIGHIVYMISPFIIFIFIHFFTYNKSDKVKNIIGYILGSISLFIIIIRNIDIFVRNGWDLEVIPLQVCHIGSIVTGLALLLKKNWLITVAFCFNLIPAFLAMVFANSLANYDTLLKIRPQTYIWGHIFIILCAFYGMFIHLPKLTKKDLYKSLIFVGCMSIVAIICNSLFRLFFNWEPNYFYLYNYKGTPLKFLYELFPSSTYGWFTINWFYTLSLILVFVVVFISLFYLSRRIINKINNKNNKL